ncbi:hypothetical protein K1T71_008418 [Dendrolimus kikuchii]|uniref:Uncharacterized protein n=1 Tax=Dendrolimus kikuchii TaxID=765133 RepID=A0ACC1CXM1_9NEOP|nr:hypothetical protein K1T71_008418 [Dendrolimus kikuchii]
MRLRKCVPKKFLGGFSLRNGLIGFAIFMSIVMACCALGVGLEILDYLGCESCSRGMLRRAYAFSIISVIYCILMLGVHLWVVWGIKHEMLPAFFIYYLMTVVWWGWTGFSSSFFNILLLCMYVINFRNDWSPIQTNFYIPLYQSILGSFLYPPSISLGIPTLMYSSSAVERSWSYIIISICERYFVSPKPSSVCK